MRSIRWHCDIFGRSCGDGDDPIVSHTCEVYSTKDDIVIKGWSKDRRNNRNHRTLYQPCLCRIWEFQAANLIESNRINGVTLLQKPLTAYVAHPAGRVIGYLASIPCD